MKKIRVDTAPWWETELDFIGDEKMPIIIIDNFHPKPYVLVEDAQKKQFRANAPYFPGVRAAIPGAYFEPLMQGLSYLIRNVFQYKSGLEVQETHYSLTTTPPDQLNMVQCLPHIDGGNDMKLALLHYLCGPKHGGTSFYKQNRTGFETVSRQRFKDYEIAVANDHSEYGPPTKSYFNRSTERFKKIYNVDARFNRAVLYFGLNIHAITVGEHPLTAEPNKGRLTANTFFNPL